MSKHNYLTSQQSSSKDNLSVIDNILNSKFPDTYLTDCSHYWTVSMPANDGRRLYQCMKCNTDITIPMFKEFGDTIKITTKHTLP